MYSTIIQIGNSKGVRIPKALLEESGIQEDVEITVTKKGITITPARRRDEAEAWLKASVASMDDWFSKEEDDAWKDL